MSATRTRGFTLIEVLGVILVTTILLSVAIDFYIDLSRETQRAAENTREVRRATSILDRVAADLERAVLVRKPAEVDPLAHPWYFIAEPRYAVAGADRIQFIARQSPRSSTGPAEHLALVAYSLRRSEEGDGFELRRWSSPGLPDRTDRDFPSETDPQQLLVADDIQHFAARFLDGEGQWTESWDSSQYLDTSELPLAVELELALGNDPDFVLAEETPRYTRQVQLPVRPLDLAQLLSDGDEDAYGGGEDGGEDEGELAGLSVADCVDFAQIVDLDLRSALMEQAGDIDFADYEGALGAYEYAIKPGCR